MNRLYSSRHIVTRLCNVISFYSTTSSKTLQSVTTPAAIVDITKMNNNLGRMQAKMTSLGVRLRPHAKTAKCVNISMLQAAGGAVGVTVSTLKEARALFEGGITDILYAVGIVETKLPEVHRFIQQGCDLKIVTDNVPTAHAIRSYGVQHNVTLKVVVEIDTDGHRAGVTPESPFLLDIAKALSPSNEEGGGGALLCGVFTHAGGSYYCDTPTGLKDMAEMERAGCVRAAQRLREAGYACPMVSTGSTPTALSLQKADGVSTSPPPR